MVTKTQKGTGLRSRMLAYFIGTILVAAMLAIYAINGESNLHAQLLQLRIEGEQQREQYDEAARVLDKELQGWKDLLLRGAEFGVYHQLLADYFAVERTSRQAIAKLNESMASDRELLPMAEQLREIHSRLSRKRREALGVYNATAVDAHKVADRLTRNIEDSAVGLLAELSRRANDSFDARITTIKNEIQQRHDNLLFAGVFLFAIATFGFSLLVDHQLGKPAQQAVDLAALTGQAETVAKFGTWEWNLREDSLYWSPGMYRMLGIDPAEPTSRQRMLNAVHEDDRAMVEEKTRAAMRQWAAYTLEYRVLVKGGSERVVQERGSAIRGKDEKVTRLTGVVYDITERKLAEARLTELAKFDVLTGLPNRNLLMDRLDHALLQAERNQTLLALLFLDLDGFKAINDAMGHAAGDKLLKQVADRLQSCLRRSDTVARFGGDEFAIILENTDHREAVSDTASKILEGMRTCFEIDDRKLFISGSIGIAFFPDDATTPGGLLKHSDAAMYRAKAEGRGSYSFFTEELNRIAEHRLTMESNLRLATERGEFSLYYQPQIRIGDGELLGVEALLRWNHDGETVPPLHFVPHLEETGLIIPVGNWILDCACRDLRSWHEKTSRNLRMAVNLSVCQLRQADLPEIIEQTLLRHGLSAHDIELEITEGALVDQAVDASVFDRLRSMGLRLAIDDFGTGYSSLSRLKELPVDNLKIDRSFIKDIAFDSDSGALISAVVSLAHRLDLQVTAEGVETEQQLAFLRTEDCDQAQGFLFAKPMEFSVLQTWFAKRQDLAKVAP